MEMDTHIVNQLCRLHVKGLMMDRPPPGSTVLITSEVIINPQGSTVLIASEAITSTSIASEVIINSPRINSVDCL